MMDINLPLIAGTISTIIFAPSTLPMLLKAYQTKDLRSYSLGNILLANVGNLIHAIYVFHLPPGPIWLLHAFHLITTGLMLVWYLRYAWRPGSLRRFRVKERHDVSMDLQTRALTHPSTNNTPLKYPVRGMTTTFHYFMLSVDEVNCKHERKDHHVGTKQDSDAPCP